MGFFTSKMQDRVKTEVPASSERATCIFQQFANKSSSGTCQVKIEDPLNVTHGFFRGSEQKGTGEGKEDSQ